ncbi:glycosyltransferase [Sphingobacterium haloxyli]|uniref:Glycosyltransferase n=1 Tax=Sphingobacterium haloxyli TaxID=2100533 RepID=A0A2S9J5Z2_9SPHI|nr:glycosyltransferase [Sphingobacterium haloxyli]PRD48218.1 glycosyltransferase [Sphingobacterium haloxyli]
MKTIVVSAVNLNVGGTLTILRDCLAYLSEYAGQGDYRVVALVYKKELAFYPNIEYIETQWPKKNWLNRLWYEYVSMKKISKDIGPVYLWFSLHDTTPNVMAERRAVYCHNPFPFYNWGWRDVCLAPQFVMFALFSKYYYQKNIDKNYKVIVQQQWLKNEFYRLFGLSKDKLVVSLPNVPEQKEFAGGEQLNDEYHFVYAASPNTHKNFECLCQAADILKRKGIRGFKVFITVKGTENKYARWLYRKWGKSTPAIQWIGFQSRETLFRYYTESHCLVFPSKAETWGLPISEFSAWNKPMLLADMPYAKETAAGNKQVAFFDADNPLALAEQMQKLIQGDGSFLHTVRQQAYDEQVTNSWDELFSILTK